MAKLTRITNNIFAGSAPSQTIEQFGSFETTSVPNYTTDPALIQALSAWGSGWTVAIASGNKAPYVQDMNAVLYVLSYQLSYLFQEGIPEWDSSTTYYINSYVQSAGQIFISLQDNNTGNMPPASATNAFWRWADPAEYVVGPSATVNKIPKVVTNPATVGPAASAVLSDSAIADNGTNVVISLPLKFPDGSVQSTAAESPFVSSPVALIVPSPVSNQSVAHGLGQQPNFYTVSIRCVNSEFGYSVNDEILLTSTGGESQTTWANATLVGVSFNQILITNKSTGGNSTITYANWRLIFRAKV